MGADDSSLHAPWGMTMGRSGSDWRHWAALLALLLAAIGPAVEGGALSVLAAEREARAPARNVEVRASGV